MTCRKASHGTQLYQIGAVAQCTDGCKADVHVQFEVEVRAAEEQKQVVMLSEQETKAESVIGRTLRRVLGHLKTWKERGFASWNKFVFFSGYLHFTQDIP